MVYEAVPPTAFPANSWPALQPQLTNKEQTKPVGRAYWYGFDYRSSRTSKMSMYSGHFLPLPKRFIWDRGFVECYIAGGMNRLLLS